VPLAVQPGVRAITGVEGSQTGWNRSSAVPASSTVAPLGQRGETMERDPVELHIDVTEAAELDEQTTLAMSLILPPVRERSSRILLFCLPGGTRRREVWNMTVPGRSNYSFAEFASNKGCVVCTFDLLATGESSRPSDTSFPTELVARTSAALVRIVSDRLRTGTLVEGMDPYEPTLTVGIGHSLGGFFTIRQQALFSSFDAVVILSYSTLFPMVLYGRVDQSVYVGLTSEDQVVEQARSSQGDPYAADTSDHGRARRMNYLDDVPADVIAAHESLKTNTPGYSWAASFVPDIVATDAASIDVPVFLGFAERDISRDPRMEVASYRGACDVTLHLLEGSAHATTCATTREQQWDRILRWVLSLARD
jgi:pimeloyl-ACP methyl ester carboxylesterase